MANNSSNPINGLIRFCLENKLVVILFTVVLIIWGIAVAPFDWESDLLPRDPVPVDAIPDIGENQQIVFTEWMGRSPQDIEDQITYPMTTALLGLPEVKTIRSYSMFGFSSIYIIFKDDAEFYWTRSRILEKLNSLPTGTLPQGVSPQLGPDATALGQVYWYTLEGMDPEGEPTGGWDLDELRSTQDWYVRYALQGVDGVAEVASIGGYVKEYQVDVDPDALRTYNIALHEVFAAVRGSNLDVGARTIEINAVEYVIRGLGFIENLDDLRKTVITQRNNVPITLEEIAEIEYGPALRRGALDKAGAEAVGGVVVTRYGENPLAVIKRVKAKIAEISSGLPKKTLEDGTLSQVEIVPFYDRTGLIYETLGTLEDAVRQQILVTIIVVVLMVMHLRSASLISGVLPLAVLFAFIGMKIFGVDANVVALSGIAIAIGTIVDMGVVLIENILKHLDDAPPEESRLEVVYRACTEVASAVVTAVLTTVISFLPVFTMEAAEGKLFRPLAYTKTFALIGSIVVALTIIPPLAHWFIAGRYKSHLAKIGLWGGIGVIGLFSAIFVSWFPWWLGVLAVAIAAFHLSSPKIPEKIQRGTLFTFNFFVAILVAFWLAADWKPLGPEQHLHNILFVLITVGGLLGFFYIFIRFYARILAFLLHLKMLFLGFSTLIIVFGFAVWLGFGSLFGWLPESVQNSKPYIKMAHAVPGLGKEFMPDLDEGSYLLMPTTMPHASIGEVMDVLSKQDMAINAIPEVDSAVGKLGRVESPLDPAPISMIETIISYKSEYITDDDGRILTYAYDRAKDEFQRDANDELIPDEDGRPFRQWRDEINSPDDIWDEIVKAAKVPGTTSAPKLQPIAARIVMLQSGMRAPMGLKVYGPDLETLEKVALDVEGFLKQVPSIKAEAVLADRIVGKPYLEIDIDRDAIARYGIKIKMVQDVIEVAVGGKPITQTVEGRERYPVRVRYMRELRDNIESIESILVAAPDGTQIPLGELATMNYLRGPQVIKSEDTFLVGYVIFDKQDGYAEVEVVEQAQDFLQQKIESGELNIPAGVSYKFTGSYENQVRAEKKLRVVLPIALFAIWLILYFQFKRISTTILVFSGILFAWSGGFIMLWLYGQPWFLNIDLFGHNIRELFQMGTINLSVAVWVGFLALFGIATDNGVIVCTYLQQIFREKNPKTIAEIRAATVEAGDRRVRPAMMTSATTILALLPVLTSVGRGSDIMVPMAIPSFGGMLLAIITIFVVPVLYCGLAEISHRFTSNKNQ
ncbi:efflux RND transporter permease subunit [Coraliomargarita sp. SDUM461004]|uniref:Efflux RND transporter permease subunit n=1 Tax=Thalassobacterium sedimentorum TaxID=3041258 RepID=A0ABU1AKA6_9BACT|nr:efflux RND transporter permease subunit [Coraliomargarita sp. SDUM461004]MDQ8195251.1 efflux RND transporter permease subunit [Coraliomargarita sp. SDUM461004]